jgi:hypothetical protein
LSKRLLKELVDYWRAQRQAKAGHDSPWLFLDEHKAFLKGPRNEKDESQELIVLVARKCVQALNGDAESA